MAPLIPRMHLFEIDDQPWFPSYLRSLVQEGLYHAWTTSLPIIQPQGSPASLVARTLQQVLGHRNVSRYTYIDFCAGAGGPTPVIEKALNASLAKQQKETENGGGGSGGAPDSHSDPKSSHSYANVASTSAGKQSSSSTGDSDDSTTIAPVNFVMTDLHPHPKAWAASASKSQNLTYEPESVDASNAPAALIDRYRQADKNQPGGLIFRLFNLAFHHFDDGLARAILKNTVETSDAIGIFEMQDRNLSSIVTCALFGLFIPLVAPVLYWWAPWRLFWVYIIPIVPFVLVFDGLISSIRTRTPEEIEVLLRTCGADTTDWEIKSGRECFMWPTGYMSWTMCIKKHKGDE
ncbi:hypothetical protein PG993_004646 [Apiospora rasikravindrae]|uniref:Uncharacterized protein n=1 Tax=Apiospora rasikravindrae TaxID=990691 RepID=A0ABR1TDF8_9PEZI